ncbi:MAG: NFACT RNA binding domain-containing protein [Bacillota bacterium]|nr:MAG: fibronectin/fibrinogen-binding protein [Bacillota bacterium]
MPFDGIALNAIIKELKECLVGGRIEKIYQPGKTEILLCIRQHKEERMLFISAHPQNCRLHLTTREKENPKTPPAFCMLLRKNISGGKIADIRQRDLERLVEIAVENEDEFGRPVMRSLVVEIMGKHSNIILIDNSTKTIIDSIKRIPSEINRVREILPGKKYVLPPLGERINILEDEVPNFILQAAEPLKVGRWMTENLMGMSKAAAKEILFRSGVDEDKPVNQLNLEERQKIAGSLVKLASDIKGSRYLPEIYFSHGPVEEPVDFWIFPLSHMGPSKAVPLKSANEAVDLFYSLKEDLEKLRNLKKTLMAQLENQISKLRQILSFQQEKLDEVRDMEKFKLFGELLSAYLYEVSPGMSEIELPNFYEDGKMVSIPLKENLSPSQNAQYYFEKYKKLRATREKVENQREKILSEIQYLESELYNIEQAENLEELEEIQKELSKYGYIKEAGKKSKGEVQPSSPIKYTSSTGFTILVGKNNVQNDMITRKANPDDIWIHVKDLPGSHVIIKTGGRPVDEETLLEGCLCAAYHSKARNSSNVAVDYTLRKHVRKPPGAKPGFVIYDHHRTVYVTPDPAFIERLKKN